MWMSIGLLFSSDNHFSSYLILGPLLYHFSDMPSEFSIELSWEDIRRVAVEEIGFEIVVRLEGGKG